MSRQGVTHRVVTRRAVTRRAVWRSVLGVGTLLLVLLPAARVEAQSAMSTVLFNTAADYQNGGEYDKAAAKWKEFLGKYADDGRRDRATFYLGICQLHQQQRAEAITTFEKVLTDFPNFTQADSAQYNLGMARYEMAAASGEAEDYRKAATAFGATADKFKQSRYAAPSLYYQGESLYAAGDVPGAIAAYTRLTKEYPQAELLGESLYALGVTQQEAGDDAAAAATFEQFLKNGGLGEHPLRGEINLRLGMTQYNQAKYNEAEKLFGEVAKLNGAGLADYALLQQANCRLELKRQAEALNLLGELLQRFPESAYAPGARLLIGRTEFQAGNWNEAVEALRPVAGGEQPEGAEAAYWLTRALLAQEKPAEALAMAEPAMAKFKEGEFVPYLAMARLDALYALPERRGATAEPYAAFARGQLEHPLAPQALYMAALVALEGENFSQARQYAEEFLARGAWGEAEVRPAVLFIAAESQLLEKPFDPAAQAKAEGLYRELTAKHGEHPRAPRAHLRIGWCLLEQKKPSDAVNYLNGVLGKLPEGEARAEANLTLGRARAALGEHKAAAEAFEAGRRALADWPRGDELLLAAAESYRELEDWKAAADRVAEFFKSHGDSPYVDRGLYLAGEIARREGKFAEAADRFGELRAKFPESRLAPAAAYAQASALFAAEDFKGTIPPLDALLNPGGNEALAPRARLLRGLAYRGLEQHDRAVDDFKAYLADSSEPAAKADARLVLGLSLAKLERHGEALAALQALLQESPNYSKADQVWYEIGQTQLQLKESEGAFTAFTTLAEKHPASPLAAEAAFHIARHHEIQAESLEEEAAKKSAWGKAAAELEKGLQRNPTPELQEKLRYKLGDMRFREGEYARAAEVLTTQVKEHPQGELAVHGRFLAAESYYRLSRHDDALPLYEQLADQQEGPYTARALYRAASCAQGKQDWSRAERHFAALLAKFPNDEQRHQARFGQGAALQMQNKLNEARAAFVQVTQESEGEVAAKALYGLGEIAFAERKFEEAIDHFLGVAVGYPYPQWQALARFEAGRCYLEQQEKENAARQFEIVVERYPEHPAARDSERLLADLKGK